MGVTRQERKQFAIDMRKNPTEAERMLNEGLKAYRESLDSRNKRVLQYTMQKARCGYIVDIYFPNSRLAVEVDGGYHNNLKQMGYDARRDYRLKQIGVKTMRFTNKDVIQDVAGVSEKIYKEARRRFTRKASAPKQYINKKKRGPRPGSPQRAGD